MVQQIRSSAFSRRSFLGLSGAAALSVTLAACSTGASASGSSSAKPIKFWDMPMGNTAFNPLDKKIVAAYKPAAGVGEVSYQVIQWANFTQTFASAVASNTGPAVSSGGGTQAFQYAAAGKIEYADNLIESWKKNGLYDDFLPGLIDTMKTKEGYAAIPQNLDMIVAWYSPSVLAKAGATLPTDWQSYLDAAEALKKIDVYGFGTGTGSGLFTGSQVLVSWMINNGGGLFDESQQPNCVTSENVEAMNFVLEMVSKGYVDPGCTQYTGANVQTQWKDGKFGLGFDVTGLAANVGGTFDGKVGTPLTGPSGKKGTLAMVNNIMMWKNTPSQKSSEAFLTYYYQHIKPLWTKGTISSLPPLKSIIETKEFQANPNSVKVVKDWQPVSKPWSAPGTTMSSVVTTVDGTPAMNVFAQSILSGKTDAKTALTTLQTSIKAAMKS
jgi:multiple sugar transport system substrate-binding protein